MLSLRSSTFKANQNRISTFYNCQKLIRALQVADWFIELLLRNPLKSNKFSFRLTSWDLIGWRKISCLKLVIPILISEEKNQSFFVFDLWKWMNRQYLNQSKNQNASFVTSKTVMGVWVELIQKCLWDARRMTTGDYNERNTSLSLNFC